MPAIGIDFGTKYTSVGVFQHGKVEIIANEQGIRKTPSFVAFSDTEQLVGDYAENHVQHVVFNAKRLIGRKFNDQYIQDNLNNWPFKLINDCGEPKFSVQFKREQQKYAPVDISAMILTKLKKNAEANLGVTIKDAVITVPTYFNDSQRLAIKQAGSLAGLHVLGLINETTAAAVAYSFNKNLKGERNMLVVDFGYGHLNVAILTVYEGLLFKVKASVGDTQLGGENFDNRLIKHVVDEFKQKYKKDPSLDERAMWRLRTVAERVKCNLSSTTKNTIQINALHDGINFSTKINRSEFEQLCADLFQSMIQLVVKVLSTAQMNKGQIDDIVLIGGSAQIPKFQEILQTFFDCKSLKLVPSPDEAVARGAAIQAAILSEDNSNRLQDMLLVDEDNNGNTIDDNIKLTNLIILACKHNKVKILEYLLIKNIKLFHNLTDILPNDVHDIGHKAFYYAIRTGNVALLDTLINKWPNNYFATNSEILDQLISRAYEELKIKKVQLPVDMEFFVEDKLINLRFFSNASEQAQCTKNSYFDNIAKRIDLVLQYINTLLKEYSNSVKVDERFILIAKFIAQNIHILKRQLKSSYARLPWEEIEFCLISFIVSHTKQQEINFFYKAILNSSKILKYLENFAKLLMKEKYSTVGNDIRKFAEIPKLKRDKVVADIIKKHPQFEDLYYDYEQIRDIHTLEKINDYIKLALSCDAKQREGQLIITRVLLMIGEYFKNTLESPKLSSTKSELLLLYLPRNTRQIIIDLRNSLSHAYSLSRRADIEQNIDIKFFIGVQNDMKKINSAISDMLNKNKLKMIKILLNKIVKSESFDVMKEVIEIFTNLEQDDIIRNISEAREDDELGKNIRELSNNVSSMTNDEKSLFKEIENIINSKQNKSADIRFDYMIGFEFLRGLSIFCDNKIDHNIIRELKFVANQTLTKILSQIIEPQILEKIAQLSMKILQSVSLRKQNEDRDKIYRVAYEIFYIAEFGTGDFKWIEDLRNKLHENVSFMSKRKQNKLFNITENKYNNMLEMRISELKNILKNNALSGCLTTKLPAYITNKRLQAVVEMLVLDIMSILGKSTHHLEDNLLFLDESSPLLTGKSLRNHLAHDNSQVDILLSDPAIAIIVNAKKLILEKNFKGKHKFGKFVRDDPIKLRAKYHQCLSTVDKQEKMFATLEVGNFDDLKNWLEKGADINARSIDSKTALHFAARGPSVEIIRFLINLKLDVNAKDMSGQSPLHVAAAYGRKNIVKFFLKETKVYIDDQDYMNNTPLHLAAKNGHEDTVDFLIKSKANANIPNNGGLPPLHFAIANNQVDVVKVLLQKEENVDINESMGGFTSLHVAAERGFLDIVNLLLKYGANVNRKADQGELPLHKAAFNGHLEVVRVLILKGADVNCRLSNDCTALHTAIENGYEEVANLLLEHGADVNAFDKTYNNTPLHYAAKDGYEKIVESLLKNGANANVATKSGKTPLHLAAHGGHLKIIAALLKQGVNVSVKDKNNATPLFYAADKGQSEAAELLIKHGAKVNVKNYNDRTPLHIAALKGHRNICELLIANEAKIETQDMLGLTPLHYAAKNGSTHVIDLLIRNKAKIDAKSPDDLTPLHIAVLSGRKDAVNILIKNKAEINTTSKTGFTLLHAAIFGLRDLADFGLNNIADMSLEMNAGFTFPSVATKTNYRDIVEILIANGANVNANVSFKERVKANVKSKANITPLKLAVEGDNKEIVEILIANGANVNDETDGRPPLFTAIQNNNKEIVKLLLKSGANVDVGNGEPLFLAVTAGFKDIVDILLDNKAHIHFKNPEETTVLHLAAKRGHKGIVKALIARGANVDAVTISKSTPLYFAASEDHVDVAEVLIANKANVNAENVEGTSLHIAAALGHVNVVEILLNNGAKVNVKDKNKRTSLELAAMRGHFEVVKILLQHGKIDMDAKGNDGLTILHIASQNSNLDIVKYLVEEGCDINVRNSNGSKPIHMAAREGFKDAVEFFLNKGLSIEECGAANQTLLHYAAMEGQLEVVKYLLAKGATVNVIDNNGFTPMHLAAEYGHKDVVKILLNRGGIYNSFDMFFRRPLDKATNEDVIKILKLTEKLFDSVLQNSTSAVEINIKAGAFVNARDSEVSTPTPLHYAASKGYDEVLKVLLQNGANPNAVDNDGLTALHNAARLSHIKMAKTLLSFGAIYDAVSDSGHTSFDLSVNKDLKTLFKLIIDSFKNVQENNTRVISEISKIKDIDTIKAVLNARNKENKSLIVVAMHSNFSEIKQLKEIAQGDLSAQIAIGEILLQQGSNIEALSIFKKAYKKRVEILGPNNPATLEIQKYIAKVLYKQGIYQEALSIFKEIYEKQKELLGQNHKDTWETRDGIALVLFRQGKREKAMNIYQEIYSEQIEALGPNHADILNTQFHMALVLIQLGRLEEALELNKEIFEKYKTTRGLFDPVTISAQNNIANVLSNQGKYVESLKIYGEVFEKKKLILGIDHADTLRTLQNIGLILCQQKKYHEGLKTLQEVLSIQKNALPQNHPETLNTQYEIGNALFQQAKFIGALKAYKACFEPRKAVFGPDHPSIFDMSIKLEMINKKFQFESVEPSEFLQHLQNDINIAASKGDIETVRDLLKNGADANDKDIDGRTPLHYAVNNKHIDIVKILLKNGADVTQITNKGNTPLHTAASKCYKDIVEVLLQHIRRDKLNDFINAKTISSGSTALHVAAQAGCLEIVKTLLQHGATYSIRNKAGKMPIDLLKDHKVIYLLNLIEQLFNDFEKGNLEAINKLHTIKPDLFSAVTNARNHEENTLVQVALTNKHKSLAFKLLEMLKNKI